MTDETHVPTGPDEIRRLVELASDLAREAGLLVHDGRPARVDVHSTKSSPQDVVTAMDLASEDLLRRRLTQRRPHDGVLGEEEGFRAGTSGVTWVVDPIDGTVNYLYGLPAYAVSVAAVTAPDPALEPTPENWTVLAGAVFAPWDGRLFASGRGIGATLDGRPIRVNPARPLVDSLLGTGFGYLAERRRAQAAVVAALLPQVRDIRRIGSAALDLCTLASGGLDLYYERGLAPWDLAAAALIAQEAGALVTGLRGAPAGRAMTVAGPPGSFESLRSLLEDLDADGGA
ncbi:inositol monophosphatase [Cellulomonas composti]|uniref:Inositol-1-monophosphatase n=1 Tax=Cellulomonas composti TaxID=266130 RepID=A0A511J706_9CELL|nr:inositol monophosphatase family protein [Cellulomonas composti]GEL93780.1 inositol monophosphatase [Cellulomonas composti]